ncbi:hypothetical protein KM043_004536 [Ampulex compressa]|nr:hypothetical protein KM043_004536 [Ampulex compressa]
MGQAGKWPSARTPCFPQPYPKTRPLSGDRRGEAKTSFTAGGNILHGQMQIFSGTSGQAEGKNKNITRYIPQDHTCPILKSQRTDRARTSKKASLNDPKKYDEERTLVGPSRTYRLKSTPYAALFSLLSQAGLHEAGQCRLARWLLMQRAPGRASLKNGRPGDDSEFCRGPAPISCRRVHASKEIHGETGDGVHIGSDVKQKERSPAVIGGGECGLEDKAGDVGMRWLARAPLVVEKLKFYRPCAEEAAWRD